jgi:hypothetical protein
MSTIKKTKKKTSPVIASTEAPSRPITKRNRPAVLLSTTAAKLAAQIGSDTPVLVSRKCLLALLQKDTSSKLLAGLEA